MAQLISVKLSRFDASPWGFRLQGGKDFGAPLVIQKVNGGSPAEKAGLQAGDAVIKVNDVELFNLRHKDAQDAIVRAGNNFEFTVQRGGSTWKPQVTPVGPASVPFSAGGTVQPVTKTSLAAKKQDVPLIGASHNYAPKPFGGAQVNGIGDPTVKSIVNKQYNTPVGMYSEETIAETLSAQAEVLAGGVLGVNFKKNEKTYNAANSEVLKMVQEIDSEPKTPEPEPSVGGIITSPPATGLRHVSAPETKPTPTTPHEDPFKVLPPGQNICADCERLIVGVFVRIKDKNLHVECFKCATCGTSLKNVGYYNINNKLYCDVHAKLAARQNPPAPNLEPITIPPGGRAPAGTISAALGKAPASNFGPVSNFAPAQARAPAPAPTYAPPPAPAPLSPGNLSPQPGTLGPLPFHPVEQHRMPDSNYVTENNMKNIITALPALQIDDSDSGKYSPEPVVSRPSKAPRGGTTHVNAPRPVQAPSSLAGPKPFSTPSAPITSPARPAPAGSKIVWPPSRDEEEVISAPTASPPYIPPSSATSSSETQTDQSAPKIPSAAIKSVPAPVPVASPPPPAFELVPVSLPPNASSKQAASFPEPFSSYLAKQQLPVRPVSSLVPIEKQTSPQPVGLQEPVSVPTEESEESQTVENAAFHKKYSLCSQEVLTINKDKPGPSFETLPETPETQMLVTTLTPEPIQRPESPVPMQDSKTSSIQDVPSTFAEQIIQPRQEQVKTVATETAPAEESQPAFFTIETSVSGSIAPIQVPSEVPQHSEFISENIQSVDVKSEEVSVQSNTVNISEQSFSSQKNEQKIEFSEEKSSNQIIVELDSALTAAPERQFSPLPSAGILSQSEIISSKSEQTIVSESSNQIISQSVSGFVPVSREQEQYATQFQQHTRQISQQSIASAETVQSLPSHEAACPSSILSALTIASDHPYSPLPPATVSLTPLPAQSSTQATNPNPFPVQSGPQAGNPTFSKPFVSDMISALTVTPEIPYSPLPSATIPLVPISVQSASLKSIVPAPFPVSLQSSLTYDDSCPSPLLSALRIAPPLPSATKAILSASQQSAPITAPAVIPSAKPGDYSALFKPTTQLKSTAISQNPASFKPSAPASKPSVAFKPMISALAPAAAPAPLPLSQTSPILKPVIGSLAASIQGQAPLDRDGACPSPMLSALTIAPERSYSPFPSATKALGFGPVQMPARQTSASIPATVKFSSSGIRPPVSQQSLRDETQLPQFTKPAQASEATVLSSVPKFPKTKFPYSSKSEPVYPQTKPSSSSLPVIGGFRPIISPSIVGLKPIQAEKTSIILPSALFARPKTPVQRVATPTPRSRSATPHQLSSRTGLQKPAAIPYYQKEIGEYPSQRPRSATPTCPMFEPRPQTPKIQPQKPFASFERQPPPSNLSSYQLANTPSTAAQSQQLPQASSQGHSFPFPNIPLPEGYKPERMTFKPLGQPVRTSAAPQPAPLAPVFKSSPELISTAPTFKPSSLTASQPATATPTFKQSPVIAPKPALPVMATQPSFVAKTPSVPNSSSIPNAGGGIGAPGGGQKGASYAGSTTPRRGKGVLTQQSSVTGARIPLCAHCSSQIRGPFVTALGKNWCPEHFVCVNAQCRRPLADIGFVEEKGELYCEYCFEKYLAPTCDKCSRKVKGDCLNAVGKHFHPECFLCAYCGKLFGNNPFFLEDGLPYCESDWNELFTTKCFACGFPIEAGDRWVEALNNNYHSQCFNCTNCKKNLEGQSFYAKGGRPFCKAHAR